MDRVTFAQRRAALPDAVLFKRTRDRLRREGKPMSADAILEAVKIEMTDDPALAAEWQSLPQDWPDYRRTLAVTND